MLSSGVVYEGKADVNDKSGPGNKKYILRGSARPHAAEPGPLVQAEQVALSSRTSSQQGWESEHYCESCESFSQKHTNIHR